MEEIGMPSVCRDMKSIPIIFSTFLVYVHVAILKLLKIYLSEYILSYHLTKKDQGLVQVLVFDILFQSSVGPK